MTDFNRHQGPLSEKADLIELFDAKGRLDPAQTEEANREIFSEVNTVRGPAPVIPGHGSIVDTKATAAKRAAAKLAIAARKR